MSWLHVVAAGAAALVVGCKSPQSFTTNVKVDHVRALARTPQGPAVLDVEVTYADCPGHPRAVFRGDRAFAQCAQKMKPGDATTAAVRVAYVPGDAEYKSDIVRLGDCERNPDPRDDASYELLADCSDLKVNGLSAGVHCDKSPSTELLAKCPWFK